MPVSFHVIEISIFLFLQILDLFGVASARCTHLIRTRRSQSTFSLNQIQSHKQQMIDVKPNVQRTTIRAQWVEEEGEYIKSGDVGRHKGRKLFPGLFTLHRPIASLLPRSLSLPVNINPIIWTSYSDGMKLSGVSSECQKIEWLYFVVPFFAQSNPFIVYLYGARQVTLGIFPIFLARNGFVCARKNPKKSIPITDFVKNENLSLSLTLLLNSHYYYYHFVERRNWKRGSNHIAATAAAALLVKRIDE